ncbi:mechanosensitive ion channel family protein [Thiosulfativibrio zosterae]|uniref:Small-conductance mechanosensitive channel n=1 Tax=Thiosulfativibrio zosterae TaxID=2675053 RepID=A0A6F8PM68_9GAMM|nr:mechanosensitive ion channel domain-containing protein [Thiosulfativibrio zosterae]BBP43203.1 mechanosensitive ion channel protein [Thiosulfativibrio zosterae]
MENFDLNMLWVDYAMPWGIKLIFALLIFVLGKWVIGMVIGVVRKVLDKSKMDSMLSNFILSIANAILLLFVVIAALSQLGVDTTSLIALIGAAGLAVGLALQNSLQNFAAGVMLIVFKPFKVGDFIDAGGVVGVVEQVGIFSSTLRSGDNKEIIVPNGSIYSSSITNFSARDTRRVDMVFGIGYDADVKLAKSILEKLVTEDERILKDPAPVVAVSELADSSINFVVRPWVNSGDYWAVYWSMNEKVLEAFAEANVSIPYPQMDVHLYKKEA